MGANRHLPHLTLWMEGAATVTAGSAVPAGVAAVAPATAASVLAVSRLPEPLAVRRIELSWVREQRRRARRVDGAAIHIQRVYRGRLGRRRFGTPNGGSAAGGAMGDGANMLAMGDGANMLGGFAGAPGVMTAASYHRQKLRATKQRADGWRPPGLCSPPPPPAPAPVTS